jgi:hypothetical protein
VSGASGSCFRPLIPAHSRPKDGVLTHAYGGNPVFEKSRLARRNSLSFHRRLVAKNATFSELAWRP